MGGLDSLSLEQLKALIEINARINSNYSDMDALSAQILESAMRLVSCELSFLFLDAGEDAFRLVLCAGSGGVKVTDVPADKNFVAARVRESDKSVIMGGPSADPHFFSFVREKSGVEPHNIIAVPMALKGKRVAVIVLVNKTSSLSFGDCDLTLLECFSRQAGIAYTNADAYRRAREKVFVLGSEVANGLGFHPFVAKSASVMDLLRIIDEVAGTDATVLITGESGVGKELFAERTHIKSRGGGPFVRADCGAPSSLLAGRLSGYFEAADGGTIFLDEIGGLSLDSQAELLRLLQGRKFEMTGSGGREAANVRVIAATRRNLEQMVSDGVFRSDLYYRLNVVPLNIPPLRERKDDIEVLSSFFLERFGRETKKDFEGFSALAYRALHEYYWPGNVRELKNSVERACVLGKPPLIQADDLRIGAPLSTKPADSDFEFKNLASEFSEGDDKSLRTALNRFKAAYLERILNETSWNQTEAARILGIQRTYVSRLLNELDMR